MNKYESVIIVKPKVETEEIIKNIEELINKEGKMEKTDILGTKKLAYKVQGFEEGQYIVFYFKSKPEVITELERIYRITEDIIKFLTIKVEDEEE